MKDLLSSLIIVVLLLLGAGLFSSSIRLAERYQDLEEKYKRAVDILQIERERKIESIRDTIVIIKKEPFKQVITRFEREAGPRDTINFPVYLADSAQLTRCNLAFKKNDSLIFELYYTSAELKQCSTYSSILQSEVIKGRKKQKKRKIKEVIKTAAVAITSFLIGRSI